MKKICLSIETQITIYKQLQDHENYRTKNATLSQIVHLMSWNIKLTSNSRHCFFINKYLKANLISVAVTQW